MTILYLIAAVLLAAPPEEPKFTGGAERLRVYFNDLFDASKKVNAPKEKKVARGKIEAALDWDRIALESLGKKVRVQPSAAQRAEYKALLKSVITLTAFTRLDKFWEGATARFEKFDFSGNEAHVVCGFHFATESVTLEYYLNKRGSKWLIYDVAYEGLRYSINVHEQIDAFLKDKSVAELLGKLRKRRDELRA